MDINFLYQTSNLIVFIGWLIIIIAPKWKYTHVLIYNVIVILLLSFYAILLGYNWNNLDLKYLSSIDNLINLIQKPSILLAFWIHYLAIDLILGLFITEHAQRNNSLPIMVTLCQIMTIISGPVGFLIYYIYIATKNKNPMPLIFRIEKENGYKNKSSQ